MRMGAMAPFSILDNVPNRKRALKPTEQKHKSQQCLGQRL